jgi:hypothetical protein
MPIVRLEESEATIEAVGNGMKGSGWVHLLATECKPPPTILKVQFFLLEAQD